METEFTITTERIDDVVLLLQMMKQIELPELLHKHLPRHWKQEGLDWCWVAVIWLAYIMSEGDHRKVVVREWVKERKTMIEQVCGVELRETDFTDDRLGIVLSKLSESKIWQEIESELSRQTISIYKLPKECVRMDATTVSGQQLVTEGGLFQFGHSKDDPSRPHLKVMVASLDPLGMPLATHVVSGEQADDGLYLPLFEQVRQTLDAQGLLWVGDCKMSALSIRAQIQQTQHYYLTPLARVGTVPALLATELTQAINSQTPRISVKRPDKKGQLQEIVTGYEVSRPQQMEQTDGSTREWTERVLLVHSPAHAQKQLHRLDERLQKASAQLKALTPDFGRGKRQIHTLPELQDKADAILKSYRVEGLLTYSYEYHPQVKRRKARYQITESILNQVALQQFQQTFGWRLYVTNAPSERLSFEQAVLTFRDAWIQESGFSRFKGKSLGASPLFVQRDDQSQGLMHLLSLGLRILTLIEFVVRRKLHDEGGALLGLFPGNPQRATARPTTERILSAFKSLSFTIFSVRGEQYGHVSPLNPLQLKLLHLLGLPSDIYSSLAASPT